MLFENAAAEYMTEKRRTRRANTVEGYESALRCHVLPRWGECEIEGITPEDVQAWVDGFELPGAAKKAYKTLRQVLRWAIRRYRMRIWLATEGVELPRMRAYRPKVLDGQGVARFLRGIWGAPEEAVAICAVTLGLRRGEACGLEWGDIDLRSGEVRVSRSRQCVGGKVVVMPTKTPKSERVLYLPRFALKRLRQIGKGARGLLCAETPNGIARRLRARCRRKGLPWVSMTNMRHTWATLAIEAGVGIETVAMMLGHTEIGTAYEHYIVPRKSICRDAQSAVERLIFESA